MKDTELEEFTAETAERAGLIQSVKSGATIISGVYKTVGQELLIEQNNFFFNDNCGRLRVGRFTDENELLKFLVLCRGG